MECKNKNEANSQMLIGGLFLQGGNTTREGEWWEASLALMFCLQSNKGDNVIQITFAGVCQEGMETSYHVTQPSKLIKMQHLSWSDAMDPPGESTQSTEWSAFCTKWWDSW